MEVDQRALQFVGFEASARGEEEGGERTAPGVEQPYRSIRVESSLVLDRVDHADREGARAEDVEDAVASFSGAIAVPNGRCVSRATSGSNSSVLSPPMPVSSSWRSRHAPHASPGVASSATTR